VFPIIVDVIVDLLLPATDAGVVVQFVVVGLVLVAVLWRSWSNPEARLLVIGSGLVILGLMGFRALH
jgi:hypothetical protein